MKRMTLLYIFVLTLFTSCQNDTNDPFEKDNETEFQFVLGTADEIKTRAWSTNFDIGDKIGIYIVRHKPNESPVLQASGNFADNKCYKISSDNKLQPNSEADKIYRSIDNYLYSVYAYYPYDSGITDPTNILFGVKTDQQTLNNVKCSDLMMAQNLKIDLDQAIYLNFKRKLSFLRVTYNKNSENILPDHIALCGLFSKSKLNLQTGVLVEGNNLQSSITPMCMYAETSSQYQYCMILPPFNIRENTVFQVGLKGQSLYYSIGKNITLREGAEHTIDLIEPQRRVTCTVKSDVGIGGTVADNEIFVKEREQCTVSAQVNDKYVFEGWFKDNVLVSKDLNYTFTVLKEDVKLEARFYVLWKLSITSNIDTNLLKPFLKSISGTGYYRNGSSAKIRTDLLPGSQYVIYEWKVDGRSTTYQWDINVQMLGDHQLEVIFVPAVYDKVYSSSEFNFISNNNFEYTFNIPSVDVFFPAKIVISNKIYAYFDGEPYDGAWYSDFPIKRVSIHSLDGEREWAAGSINGGHAGTSFGEDCWMSVKYQLKFKYILTGNVPIRGKVHYRTYGFRWEDVPKE